MYFHKTHHLLNFIYHTAPVSEIGSEVSIAAEECGNDIYRIFAGGAGCSRWADSADSSEPGRNLGSVEGEAVEGKGRFPDEAQLELDWCAGLPSTGRLTVEPFGGITLELDGKPLLASLPQASFGLCGSKWIFNFTASPGTRFYGMGEKSIGFEKSGIRTKFWNTDVWADFSDEVCREGTADPMYISIPYLLVKAGQTGWVGILVRNPFPVFMDTGARQVIEGVRSSEAAPPGYSIGSADGRPELYLIAGHSPARVTQSLQRLTGLVPRPPLWALGYHQSRWGYGSADDLEELDGAMTRYGIPCDALWLDIDYLDGYRTFSVDTRKLPDPATLFDTIGRRSGRKVVPILDPGIKRDPAYAVYREGLERRLFCLTAERQPYVGFVWPGPTCFPDFSLPEARQWWAELTAGFARSGIGGVWIDMNDPSTGSSELEEMRFLNGTLPHAAYHNQYANGMAAATRCGLLAAAPDARPFILSRSGYIGINRTAAVWTGDNFSSYAHLRKGVEIQLGLSLSGVPFVGADLGGFGGDTDPALLIDWFKASFLLPFFRNHSADGTAVQEPWAFGAEVLARLKGWIQARYSLRPYLYHLFLIHEETGDPIVRPMLYHYAGFERTDSQFLVGPDILQAPRLDEGVLSRMVTLPTGQWYDCIGGTWVNGPAELEVPTGADGTPIFLREGALIPISRRPEVGDPLTEIDLVIGSTALQQGTGGKEERVPRGGTAEGEADRGTAAAADAGFPGHYRCDSGEGWGYRSGEETELRLEWQRTGAGLDFRGTMVRAGYRPLLVRVVVPVSRIQAAGSFVPGEEPADCEGWIPATAGTCRLEITLSDGSVVRKNLMLQPLEGCLPFPGSRALCLVSDIIELR